MVKNTPWHHRQEFLRQLSDHLNPTILTYEDIRRGWHPPAVLKLHPTIIAHLHGLYPHEVRGYPPTEKHGSDDP